MENNRVIIEPIKELAGVFQKYSIKDKPIDEIMKLEKKAFAIAIKKSIVAINANAVKMSFLPKNTTIKT